jgi:hypothetical protein
MTPVRRGDGALAVRRQAPAHALAWTRSTRYERPGIRARNPMIQPIRTQLTRERQTGLKSALCPPSLRRDSLRSGQRTDLHQDGKHVHDVPVLRHTTITDQMDVDATNDDRLCRSGARQTTQQGGFRDSTTSPPPCRLPRSRASRATSAAPRESGAATTNLGQLAEDRPQ